VAESHAGIWEEYEAGIRDTIGSGFRWRVPPPDTPMNREMVADLMLHDLERGNGTLPDKNAFIQRAKDPDR